ncbi:hypothetical protein P5W99_11005 [Paraburkholderia sp. A3BS-1L]|uniref:hypothetical protein n=1 Tax=Paraburkholderia sp. A3BS-1L TaxID=3028375 RepID=UPI003DA91DB3
MATLPSILLDNLLPRVLAIRQWRKEGWAIDELRADIDQRMSLLGEVGQQEACVEFYRLSVRLETALARLTGLRERLRHRQEQLAASVVRLERELADEALAYLTAEHKLRLGEVYTVSTGDQVELRRVEFDAGAEPPKAYFVGVRVFKNGQRGGQLRLLSLVYESPESQENPQ